MDDQNKPPERIWATGDARNGSWTDTAPARDWDAHAVEYVRAEKAGAERDHWKRIARHAGVCMTCQGPNGAPEPYGCSDCLNTGWSGEYHNGLADAENELSQALATNERWRRNSTETWEAMTAMRNEINQHIPMPSIESDLLQGPENSIFCASVAEAVISGIQARAAAAAMEMRERAVSLATYEPEECDRLGSTSQMEVCDFGEWINIDDVRALPIDPDAQKALDKMLARAREDAIREAAHLIECDGDALGGKSGAANAILALLNDGGQP
ncbi:hypothetical protein SAMN04489859_100877 [Paracoccus alcaliphilus]|uniref:Uncharacterized protein n=1 Tax=Paracoccus alcaliphilus TaxID=34002 RepID=A0A1H8H3X5_9RHOB|nr:hypothetical protein [Paracoccus alcaliphilus]WCR20049.1 hypothetical protein JHW40_13845 [Paracoccus alcaliphilus]SEN50188.1 hypothetical protein SAMN04489859_100877 [Paracoccus alcaliphilus]